jgi:ribonuclease T
MAKKRQSQIARRFRGFLPVVVDVETTGLNPELHALLEIAIVLLKVNPQGVWQPDKTIFCHITPFEGAQFDEESLKFLGIDPYHPFRFAISEQQALKKIFTPIQEAVKEHACSRAILVGHNPTFDLSFIQAASERNNIKSPFHKFSTFDTATLGGLVYGQTVLAKAVRAAGFTWEANEAHSAIYDAERTADLFCNIVNMWNNR